MACIQHFQCNNTVAINKLSFGDSVVWSFYQSVKDVYAIQAIYSVYQKDLSKMIERCFLVEFLLNPCNSDIK